MVIIAQLESRMHCRYSMRFRTRSVVRTAGAFGFREVSRLEFEAPDESRPVPSAGVSRP